MIRKLILIGVAGLSAVFVLGLTLPALSPGSNCGGNSAALFVCKIYAETARIDAKDNGGVFEPAKLQGEDKKEIARLAHYHWIPDASLLVKRGAIRMEGAQRTIIAVCDKAYGNVPQPMLWNGYKKTPAHAVAYSDGSVELISAAQFKSL